MRRILRIALLAVLVALTLTVGGMTLLSVLSRPPENLGVSAGRLADCPDTPNCVCSFAHDPQHEIQPLRFTGFADEAMAKLKRVLQAMPGARIVTTTDRYLHAEFTSRLFRFVDDVEFLIDPAQNVIHVRSASRAGKSDLGVNRARVESIRNQFASDER